jgi:hypothetical protein
MPEPAQFSCTAVYIHLDILHIVLYCSFLRILCDGYARLQALQMKQALALQFPAVGTDVTYSKYEQVSNFPYGN